MTAGSPHSFAIATDGRIPARHLVSRVRGSAADWQPHGVGHAVARDTESGLCQNTTLCGKSVYNLHLFAELAFARGAATCPDCTTIFISRRHSRALATGAPERA